MNPYVRARMYPRLYLHEWELCIELFWDVYLAVFLTYVIYLLQFFLLIYLSLKTVINDNRETYYLSCVL